MRESDEVFLKKAICGYERTSRHSDADTVLDILSDWRGNGRDVASDNGRRRVPTKEDFLKQGVLQMMNISVC
jgi:hypothetical protein